MICRALARKHAKRVYVRWLLPNIQNIYDIYIHDVVAQRRKHRTFIIGGAAAAHIII